MPPDARSTPTADDNPPPPPPPQRIDVQLVLPTRTIVKVLVTLVVVWAMLRLWPECVFLLISLLLAIALHPVVNMLERRGLSRAASVGLLAIAMFAVMVLFVTVVSTSLAEQLTRLAETFPTLRASVEERLPARYPFIKRAVGEIFALPSSPELAERLKRPLALGTAALSSVVSLFFMFVVTIYLLLDGKRLYAWLIAYVPRAHRDRMAVTADEVSQVVYSYVFGQAMISALFTIYAGIVLTICKVPAAFPLALLAGLCDVLPVVGVILATVPAALLALTVSPATAALVFALYIGYHLVEAYFIAPRIYGQRLRLSTLAVLLALLVGFTLQGLVGAILILPVIAAYPIVERLWLADYLSSEVLKDHRALSRAAEAGGREEVVDTVLQGEKHPWEGNTGTLAEKHVASVRPRK